MLILLAMLLQSPTAPPESLKPVGKWNVTYTDTGCTLSRSFGDEATPVKLRFTPATLGGWTTVLLDAPDGSARPRQTGDATLLLQPENRTQSADYQSLDKREPNRHAVAIRLTGQEISAWRGVEKLAISLDKAPPVTIELQGMQAGVSALQKCHDDLLRGWQVDPAELAAISVSPKLESDLGPIFDPRYLRNGLPKGELRRIHMLFTVGIDGLVSACRVIETSGHEVLDAATCALSTGRIRYQPGRDKSGQLMVSHVLFAVRWTQSN